MVDFSNLSKFMRVNDPKSVLVVCIHELCDNVPAVRVYLREQILAYTKERLADGAKLDEDFLAPLEKDITKPMHTCVCMAFLHDRYCKCGNKIWANAPDFQDVSEQSV